MYAKVIAIAGAGGFVGKAFSDALLEAGSFELRILTRESSIESAPLQEFKKRGATLHAISYDNEASIVKALQGVDVVISAVAGEALVSAQIPLIKASKASGVKTFMPSEFGSTFHGDSHPSPVINGKKLVLKAAKDIGLPLTAISNGGFPEYCFIPPLGYNFAEKKVTIWGDGNAKSTWTTVRSSAQWVTGVFKTVPIEQLQNKHFKIQGNSVSADEVVKLWEQKHNDKLQVEYRPTKELDDRVEADSNDFFAVLLQEWSSGLGELKGLDNELYPDWKPEPIEVIL